jgi:hypothetical protein
MLHDQIDQQTILESIRMKKTIAVVGALLAALSFSVQAQAATLTEVGDAGETLGTASATGSTSGVLLTSISGTLSSATDADIYIINITAGASFSAITTGSADTQLFLFDAAGNAVYGNDDDPSGLTIQSLLPANDALSPKAAGLYYLAVSVSGYNPVNLVNQLLFADGFPTDILGPASGVNGSLAGFSSSVLSTPGAYTITLTSATTAVPEPSPLFGLFSMGALSFSAASLYRKFRRA